MSSTNSAQCSVSRRFPLWDSDVEAARSWIEHGERTPSKARRASAVVLVRDSPRGARTLLSHRRGGSPLGAVSFPGGAVEGSDDAEVDWIGPSPAAWAKTLSLADANVARRHLVAAIRELFGQTGILLAATDPESTVDLTGNTEVMAKREAIVEQDLSFSEFLGRRGLAVRTDLLKPVMNWISPDFAHHRFDTWYFAAAAPVDQSPTPLRATGTWVDWVCPKDVLDANGSALGERIGADDTVGSPIGKLISAGTDVLLRKVADAKGCIAFLNQKRPPMAFQPQLRHDRNDVWLEVETPANLDPVRRER